MNYYDKNADEFIERTINTDMTNIYKEFEKHIKKNSSIIDLGCGPGRDVKYFEEKGYNVTGLDNSIEMVKKAKEYTNSRIILKDINDIEFSHEFDAVWASASLLHIPRNDMKNKVLKKIINSINDGGIIYMSFKYGNFEGYRNQRYFTDYDEDSIKDLINNYQIINIWTTEDNRIERSQKWINAIFKK